MIEIIKEETMEERDKRRRAEGFSLPKNIRQIGEAQEGTRVYIEDYVMTYFKQLATYEAENEIVLILYGYVKENAGICYYFVSGAIRVRDVNSCLHNTLFNQEDWQKINEEAANFFGPLSVLGWALMKLEDAEAFGDRIIGTHEEFFRTKEPIFVQYMIADKEEKVYLYQNGEMKEQKGHYVYYDRNDMMQNYLVSLREEENKVEEEQTDHAAKQFRMVVQEKKERRKRRKTNALLYATSLVLAFVIVLIGITMLNNYEKMQDMEKVLYQIANKTSTQERTMDDEYVSGQAMAGEEDEALMAQSAISQPQSGITGSSNALKDISDEMENNLKGQDATSVMSQNTNASSVNTNGQAVSVNAISDNAIQTSADGILPAENTISQKSKAETQAEEIQMPSGEDGALTAKEPSGEEAMQTDVEPSGGEKTQTDAESSGGEKTQAGGETAGEDGAQASEETNEAAEQTNAPVYQTYRIKRGDTLEKINRKFYGNVDRINEICALNNIQNKDNICYGEKILLPQ